MPINFTCDGCGKPYVVSDGLAGKKAACKQCGQKMIVPGVPAATGGGVGTPVGRSRPPGDEGSIPTARPIPKGIPRARPVSMPPQDVYGFDEAPAALPPLTRPTDDEPAEPAPKKKKKKKGFFAPGGRKKATASSQGGGGMSGLRLGGLLIVIALGTMGGIRGLSLSSKSEVVAFHQRVVDRFSSLVTTLQTVNDVESARRVSPDCVRLIDAMTDDFNTNGRKKARISDIKAVERDVMPQLLATRSRLDGELMRLGMIPGALDALQIQGPLMRLETIGRELADENARAGIN